MQEKGIQKDQLYKNSRAFIQEGDLEEEQIAFKRGEKQSNPDPGNVALFLKAPFPLQTQRGSIAARA